MFFLVTEKIKMTILGHNICCITNVILSTFYVTGSCIRRTPLPFDEGVDADSVSDVIGFI